MSECSIDVLIAVRNGEKTIHSSIESIQLQTEKNIRIIVVDDGSTDNTVLILNALALLDKRIVVVLKPHSGIADSLNYGLSLCGAEFIARFDADDISYPMRLHKQLTYLKENPDCLAVSSAFRHINEHGELLGGVQRVPPIENLDASWIPSREPFLMQTLLMLRKSALESVGGYRLCEVAEDSDLYWRLNEMGRMHNLDEVLGAYRLNPESISSKSIVHGRKMAFWSQLIGLSALRRKYNVSDINFNHERIYSVQHAITLDDFCRLGGKDLSLDEFARLCTSASTKLMIFATYRPFELEKSDCKFIHQSLKNGDIYLTDVNRKSIRELTLWTAMRLLGKRKFAESYSLIRYLMPYLVFLWVMRRILPKPIRSFLNVLAGRSQTTKAS